MRSSSQTIQNAHVHRQHQPPLAFYNIRRSVSNPERAALYRAPFWLSSKNQNVARPCVSSLPSIADFLARATEHKPVASISANNCLDYNSRDWDGVRHASVKQQ